MERAESCEINLTCGADNCMGCWVKKFSLLKDLNEQELEIINQNRGSRTYKSGEFVFEEGAPSQGLLALRSGKVKITKKGVSGKEVILSLNKPVHFLGLEALILEKPYCTSAIALEDVAICYIDTKNFLKVLRRNADLSMKVMTLLAEKAIEGDKRMLILTQKHLRGRLADALLLLHKIYGFLPDNETLNIELKRAEIAAMANMTAANAIRILSEFNKENLIETKVRKIRILNMKRLENVSQLG